MLILTEESNSATTRQTPRNHKASPSLLSPKFHAPLPPPSFLPPTLHQYSLSRSLFSSQNFNQILSEKKPLLWPPVMSNPATDMPPGFRFHPTDEELILHYLRNRAVASPLPVSIIAEVDIYKFNPWDLPAKAVFGEQEWYFFSPRDRKYPNGIRPNRTAASGYWKATGTDKLICSGNENIGVKKALVFYKGRPPKGIKTDWIMHEYRLADSQNSNNYKPIRLGDHSMRLDDSVLCRIYKKRNHLSPAMADQEQEDMCTDDSCVHTTQNHLVYQHHGIKILKTPFTSNFLEEFSPLLSNNLNDQQELIRFGHNSLFGHPITNQSLINQSTESSDNGYLHPQFLQAESPVSFAVKCQSVSDLEESSGSLQPLKKKNELSMFPNFSSQFYGSQSQYNLLNQPYFNLQ